MTNATIWRTIGSQILSARSSNGKYLASGQTVAAVYGGAAGLIGRGPRQGQGLGLVVQVAPPLTSRTSAAAKPERL